MKLPRSISVTIALLAVLTVFLVPAARAASESDVTIFAAASTSNAITEIAAAWEAAGNGHVRMVFASSGVLARQIDSGAPADLFLSANPGWMDWLAGRGNIEGEPVAMLGNRLVLIQSAGAPILALDETLLGQLAGKRLAIGDPDHVPAGIYARQALESMKLWGKLGSMAIRMKDARATLLLVKRGEAAAGIVYASDAQGDSRLQVAAVFPEDTHEPIIYSVAVVKEGNSDAARRFLNFLKTGESAEVFRRHGFRLE
jgi:molybdate transport system substrate-binding protein